ncbi:leucine-rich repeat receptor protein kinase HPCA1-like isoform X4 [Hevea brasiliensis]|uniref:leucine-rich repeat receptor protein kinase HPCA1-like isoform X4 n=1 Tax=Hevea brasiliensis TaxID=3981 RepID=UPI0025CF64B8|nr:leucine-rich repeat receptor protein kinase HPCA1-like isoform X4 [Hevea brasiliensis]
MIVSQLMGPKQQIFLLFLFLQVFAIAAKTDTGDFAVLSALMKDSWKNKPSSWTGGDPCGDKWEGIQCSNSRITDMVLSGQGLAGKLTGDIGNLIALEKLDLSLNKDLTGNLPPTIGNLKNLKYLSLHGCSFSGPIPDTIGSLNQLLYLSLGANNFTGEIPHSFGNLLKLYWLDITDNNISGEIPVSNETSPGLDLLVDIQHFHFGQNELEGTIPPQLFSSKMKLLHVDMSNNSFDASSIPQWFSSLQSLTTLIMENTLLQGRIPVSLFSSAQLQTISVLSNNKLNGTLDIGTRYSRKLKLIDLQKNDITQFTEGYEYNGALKLEGNPICGKKGLLENYCIVSQQPQVPNSTQRNNCDIACGLNQLCSPNCKYAYPITGTLRFLFVSFQDLGDASYYQSLEANLTETFQSEKLPVDSIRVSDQRRDMHGYLELRLQIFPSGSDRFNRTGFSMITSQLNNFGFFPPLYPFGSFHFILDDNEYFTVHNKSSNIGIIIGASAVGFALLLLLLVALVYAFNQRRKVERASQLRDPFASWDNNGKSGSRPQITGLRCFSFEEIKKSTSNFSDANIIGTGGYGKVYRGILTGGIQVAIKRAEQGSLQGSVEFKTEIELLSKIYHKNLVSLLGFCYEVGEQMLVYEYVSNGSLKDCISGKSGVRLSWERRLKIALDSARGLAYLHDHVNPPIIHRDVKSSNILLDDQLNGKVADFGLSKLLGHSSHVSDNVKGTMGYVDPEYYLTLHSTEKSDVYSFGVIMLELITGRKPIEHGRYIVTMVKMAMDKTKHLYNLQHLIIDPTIAFSSTLKGLEKFVDLAIRCVEELRVNRPTMTEVVKEIENILQQACLHSDVEMVSNSNSQDVSSGSSFYSPIINKDQEYSSGSFPYSEIELK